jgi:hypothetical protein
MSAAKFENPFRPGAGHMPPYLAGREQESKEFKRLLGQGIILENLVLSGLRGLGKTVLLETFKPMAIEAGWLWAGTDLSESTSISEENLAIRLLTDVSVVTSMLVVSVIEKPAMGMAGKGEKSEQTLNFETLSGLYNATPGLVADKLKAVLELVWEHLKKANKRGLIFAYDEAQNLADHRAKDQYPLSLLLDVFQSLQRKNVPFMLALVGLPTLFPKLVEARTFAERMFRVVFLDPLNRDETFQAIKKPMESCPIKIAEESLDKIWETTHGYPYFVQYVCRELYDVWAQSINAGKKPTAIPSMEITRKLDTDFFSGRWARTTDRQRELLSIVARLPNCDSEFSVQEVIEHTINKGLEKPFGSSHVNQMFTSLTESGLIYKNRHGKYSFAVPLLGEFIRRQMELVITPE